MFRAIEGRLLVRCQKLPRGVAAIARQIGDLQYLVVSRPALISVLKGCSGSFILTEDEVRESCRRVG